MPMYNLTEYIDNYSQTSESLWQYYKDQPALGKSDNITDFPSNNDTSLSFKYKKI